MTIFLTPFFTAYVLFTAFVLGAVMGSFLNCASMRTLSGEPIARGRSHCMSCGHRLGFFDLIPLFSWLFLKGRCRYCGSGVHFRYPLTELITGVVYALLVLRFDLTLLTVEYIVFCSILLCVTLTDLEEYIIPDRFIIIGIINRIIFIALNANLREEMIQSAVGAFSISLPVLILSLILDRILKKDTMGGGDIKLFFMAGMYFAWQVNILALFFSAVSGIMMNLLPLKNEKKQIPFGPAISIAYVFVIFCGDFIVNRYMSLF